MTGADLDAVIAVEQASFTHPWRREHFEHEIAAPHSFPFVAVAGDILVGYVCLMSLFEEAQILDIAVAPDQRGKGFGKLLMDHAAAIAVEKGAGVLGLEVRSTNGAAVTLYEQLGFRRCGVRSRYYEGIDDALLMEMILPPLTGMT